MRHGGYAGDAATGSWNEGRGIGVLSRVALLEDLIGVGENGGREDAEEGCSLGRWGEEERGRDWVVSGWAGESSTRARYVEGGCWFWAILGGVIV